MREFFRFSRGPKYEYFRDSRERHDIFEFSKELAKYLREENISNIIFLDRGARPAWVGLDEYWKINYPDTKRPNIYFINPDAFQVMERTIKEMFGTPAGIDGFKLMLDGETMRHMLQNPQIQMHMQHLATSLEDEFEKRTDLSPDKEKTLAVFDNCIHFGRATSGVLAFLRAQGFDVRLVIADDTDNYSRIQPNVILNQNAKKIDCYPFGDHLASGVKKGESAFSYLDPKADRKKVVTARHEIRQIIRNQGK